MMNIQTFSMPETAYLNPTMWGDLSGINLATWHLSHLLADTKFITIFLMLFGAGICLFADRADARGGRAAALHYRRMFWLLGLGLEARKGWSMNAAVTVGLSSSRRRSSCQFSEPDRKPPTRISKNISKSNSRCACIGAPSKGRGGDP